MDTSSRALPIAVGSVALALLFATFGLAWYGAWPWLLWPTFGALCLAVTVQQVIHIQIRRNRRSDTAAQGAVLDGRRPHGP